MSASSDERFARAHEIFNDALERGDADREAFVERECASDAALIEEVKALLAAHDDTIPWIDDPAGGRWDDLAGEDQHIGPYRLVRELGSGGMGVVWEAEQTEPVSRRVALKLIRRGMDTRDITRRFQLERQTLFSLEHPHIARAYDAGVTDDGRPYFAMELVDGPPLTTYCEEEGLKLEERVELFLQFCRAVQFAHLRGVLHRDLKPSNVLVSREQGDPVPKVIDFGIAKAIGPLAASERTQLTGAAQPIGTPETMSPEQAHGSPLDVRTDVYSAGVLLYRLLTGRYPFNSEELPSSDWSQVQKTLSTVLPEAPSAVGSETAADLPTRRQRELDWIVLKALAKEPERRYQSMEELAQDLERFLRSEAVEAGPVSWPYRTRKFVERNRVAVGVGATIGLTVLLSAIGLGVQAVQLRAALVEAEERRQEAEEVSDLMSSLFRGANVLAEGRRDVTALELLERGESEVRDTFGQRPLLLGRMLLRIGDSTRALGDLPGAAQLLAEAASVLEEAGDLEALSAAQRQLATVSLDQAQPEQAMALAEAAVATARSAANDVTLTEALAALSNVQVERGELEAARETALEAVTLAAESDEVPSALSDEALGALALTEMRSGRTNKAANIFLDLEERAENAGVGVRSRRRASLGLVLIELGRSAEALPFLESALEHQSEVLGRTHLDTLATRTNIALAASNVGQLERARDTNLGSLEAMRELTDEPHFFTARFLNNLGLNLHGLGDLGGAEKAFREALEQQRGVVGDDHPNLAFHLSNLGRLLHETGRWDEAEQAHRRALRLREKHLSPEHPSVSDTVVWLGALLLDAGRLEEAVPYLERGVAIREAKLAENNWRTAEARSWLGSARIAQGRVSRGLALVASAYPLIREQRGDAWQRTAPALERLISAFEAAGRPDEAEAHRRLLVERHPERAAEREAL
ncbi:MAG: serine/threonine-protein kinase [Acidobacteriota bacterium]